MSLVPYLERSAAPSDVAEMYRKLESKYNGKLFNTFRMLGHLPEVLSTFVPFVEALFQRGKIDRRLRELIILRATLLNKSNYCATHHFYAAKMAGLTYDEIRDIYRYRESPFFTEREKMTMEFAGDLTLHPGRLDPELAERMRAEFDPASLVEITAIIGMTNFLNRFDDALGIELDLPSAPVEFYPKRERWMHDED